jgi:hypothetical protein
MARSRRHDERVRAAADAGRSYDFGLSRRARRLVQFVFDGVVDVTTNRSSSGGGAYIETYCPPGRWSTW